VYQRYQNREAVIMIACAMRERITVSGEKGKGGSQETTLA
jgi:hypothetical protein